MSDVPAVVGGHTIFSPSNRRRLEHWVWVPPDLPAGTTVPLLVLIHGVYDSASCWWDKGTAHGTAARLVASGEVPPFVLLMAGDTGHEQGSGYCDWVDGSCAAETYLVDELLPWADANLPVAGQPRWISGLSMGGYGSLLLALRHPGAFAAATSLSGFFDPRRMFKFVPDAAARMWGDGDGDGIDAHDVRLLIQDADRRAGLRIAFDCGVDDDLIDQNRTLHAQLVESGVDHGYLEHPGGHEWAYWSTHVADHMRFVAARTGPLA